MSQCVMVTCPSCAGTGYGKDTPVCDVCLGQLHISVNRTHDGGVPDGYTEWRTSDLGPIPDNPLVLRNARPTR